MRTWFISTIAAALFVARVPGMQNTDELRGFTVSPAEHIIERMPGRPRVNAFKGIVLDPSGYPLASALVEIRCEKPVCPINATRTRRSGAFSFHKLAPGNYIFKITDVGFQSLVGHIEIAPTGQGGPMKLHLKAGV